jgi:hypothetical protein
MYGNEDKFFEIFETGPTQICADLLEIFLFEFFKKKRYKFI